MTSYITVDRLQTWYQSWDDYWLMIWLTWWSKRCTLSMRWLLSCWLCPASSLSYNIFVRSGKSRLRSTLLLLLLPINELSPPCNIHMWISNVILTIKNELFNEIDLTAAVAVFHPSGFILGIRWMRVVWMRWTIDEFPARYSSHK